MHSILEAETAADPMAHRTEHRRALRQMARRVTLTGTADETRVEIALQDLSRRGVRFRSVWNIPCATTVSIDPDPESGLARLDCRIVRVQAHESAGALHFEYGAQIVPESREQGHRWFLYFCFGDRLQQARSLRSIQDAPELPDEELDPIHSASAA